MDYLGVSILSLEEGGFLKDGVGRGKKEGDVVYDYFESKGWLLVVSFIRGIIGEVSLVGVVDLLVEIWKLV